jgi:glycosyltransferase involved in cell wall biosynthesis
MKPRILLILHVPPPIHGAAMVGKYIMESNAIKASFDVDFICLSTSKSLQESGKGTFQKAITLLSIQIKVIKAIMSKSYDLCYMTLTSSGPGFYKDVLVVAILKLFKRKIIYHFHNKGVASASKNRINNLLYRFVFTNAQCILLSHHLYPDIKQYVKQENVFICANGVPALPEIDLKTSNRNPLTEEPCRLLFLSNLMVDKGVFTLLKACQLLKNKKNSFECHFVGAWSDISEEMFQKKLKEYDISDVVFAHGPKYDQEKIPFFKSADIFVLPTYHEAFPLVNLEAMQLGLPIVASAEGGIPDIVTDGVTGFLTQKHNAVELAEKLESLIHDPRLRIEMGKAAVQKYKRLFTLEKFETNMVQVLLAAVNKSFIKDYNTIVDSLPLNKTYAENP